MIHFSGQAGLTNTATMGIFTGLTDIDATPGVTGVEPNAWLPRATTLYTMTHARPAATGVGNSFLLSIYDGTSAVATFSFGNSDGTSKSASVSSTLTAAANATNGEAHLMEQVLTGSASAAGSFTLVYQDASIPGISWHRAGSGTANIGVGVGATEYIGFHGGGTTGASTENNVAVAWPLAGTFQYIAINYTNTGGSSNTYNFRLRKNLSATDELVIPMPNVLGTPTLILDTSSTFSVTAGDLVTIGFTHTGGSGSVLVVGVTIGFIAS